MIGTFATKSLGKWLYGKLALDFGKGVWCFFFFCIVLFQFVFFLIEKNDVIGGRRKKESLRVETSQNFDKLCNTLLLHLIFT